MTLAPLLVLLLASQDALSDAKLDKTVTVRIDAASIPYMIQTLTTLSPIKLEASASLNNQVLLIDVSDVPIREVLTRVAEVADCEWTKTKDGLRIEPSPAKRAATKHKSVDRIAKVIAITLAKFSELAKAEYNAKGVAGELQDRARPREESDILLDAAFLVGPSKDHNGVSPAGRGLARAISVVDPAIIAALRFDERIVFSTDPSEMQRQLQIEPKSEEKSLHDDSKVFSEATKLVRKANKVEDEEEPTEDVYTEDVARIDLVISRKTENFGVESITANYLVFNKEGRNAIAQEANLWTDAETMSIMMSSQEKQKGTLAFEAKPNSQWQFDFFSNLNSGDKAIIDDARFKAIMHHPETREPLSLLVSDCLVAIARGKHSNIIAEVSDTAILVGMTAGSRIDSDTRYRQLTNTIFDELSESENWMLLRPKDAPSGRDNRVSRAALGQFMRLTSQQGLVPVSEYVAHRGTSNRFNLVELLYLIATIPSGGMFGFPEFIGMPPIGLEFIGLLEPSTRLQFLSGRPLSYSALTGPQKASVMKQVFGSTGAQTHNFMSFTDPKQEDLFAEFLDKSEPTRLLPKGVPPKAQIIMLHKDTPVLFGSDDSGKTWEESNEFRMASAMASKVNPKYRKDRGENQLQTLFRFGLHREYALKIWVTNKDFYGATYRETLDDPTQAQLSFDQLPPTIKKTVNDRIKNILRGFEERGDKSG